MAQKIYPDATSALDGLLRDGLLIASGGFGLCGLPERLLDAIRDSGVKDLTFVSNNAGIDGEGIGKLLRTRQVRKMCDAIGHPVRTLKRVRIGPIADRHLRLGTYRELTPEEVRRLKKSATRPSGSSRPAPRRPTSDRPPR